VTLIVTQLIVHFSGFYYPAGSLLRVYELATGLSPETDNSLRIRKPYFYSVHFNIILPVYLGLESDIFLSYFRTSVLYLEFLDNINTIAPSSGI
jgi:hypothetical protein